MNPVNTICNCLSNLKNQKTLTFLAGGLIIAIAGGCQSYLPFSEQAKEPVPTVSASNNSNARSENIKSASASPTDMTSFNIEQIVTKLRNARPKRHQENPISKDEDIEALTQAVTFISNGKDILGTEAEIKKALEGLVQGDKREAYALLFRASLQAERQAKQAAIIYRSMGY